MSNAVSSSLTIERTATRLGVSSATIRNWIKTNYLEAELRGFVTLRSIAEFESNVLGKGKLNQRANKSCKNTHNHSATASNFINRIQDATMVDLIGSEYEASLSESYRNKEGVYYTPSDVVNDLFSTTEAISESSTFCDPCCGSGNFVIRAVELGFKPENIYGYDIDPVAVEITKARIFKATGYKSKNIKVADFLSLPIPPNDAKFDYIFTNPPWGCKLPKETKELYGLKFNTSNSLDSCSLFFFACLEYLKESGKLGFLLPESFFNVASFEKARSKAFEYSIDRLVNYGKVFKGLVTQAQAITLAHAKGEKPIQCQNLSNTFERSKQSFIDNPKSIMNLYCDDKDANTLDYLMSLPFVTLANQATWGLGIVTGNNAKYVKSDWQAGHMPVVKGSDISQSQLKPPTTFIPSDLSLYHQVAPTQLYQAKEKLVYKFISNRLCFFLDSNQRFLINSANMLIIKDSFPVSMKVMGELLSCDFMNWIFAKIFNSNKVLRGDLESLPIHSQFLTGITTFDETKYLDQLNLYRESSGTYRIKK